MKWLRHRCGATREVLWPVPMPLGTQATSTRSRKAEISQPSAPRTASTVALRCRCPGVSHSSTRRPYAGFERMISSERASSNHPLVGLRPRPPSRFSATWPRPVYPSELVFGIGARTGRPGSPAGVAADHCSPAAAVTCHRARTVSRDRVVSRAGRGHARESADARSDSGPRKGSHNRL